LPTISYFYGIYIRMYVKEHSPPYFHAVYGEFEANVSIDAGEVIEGRLPLNAAPPRQGVDRETSRRIGVKLASGGGRIRSGKDTGSRC
jgi:hypothetical protein